MSKHHHANAEFEEALTPTETEGQDSDYRREQDRRGLAIWLAAGGVAAVIAALWLLILPNQLRLNGTSEDFADSARWSVVKPFSESAQTFKETMAKLRTRLEAMSPPLAEQAASFDVIEAKSKLEAALRVSASALPNASADAATAPAGLPTAPDKVKR